ncbi:hypothetical protein KKD03_03785 [Patescibacteria group bacterium]|nr:hypothetical protein [Patescibacteria group bacterium]
MSFKLISTVFAEENPCGAGEGGGIDLGNCLKLSDSAKISEVYNTPSALVDIIIKNMFPISGVIIFVMLFLAGYKFITKGKDGMEEAKKIVTTTLIGFLVMFSAFWIVQIISLLTGINIPGIAVGN